MLSVLSDPVTGAAPVSFTEVFLREERMPFLEGWRMPQLGTNWPTLLVMSQRIMAVSPPEEEVEMVGWTMEGVFSGAEVEGSELCQLGGTGCEGLSKRRMRRERRL